MQGNFEIKTRILRLNNSVFIIHGYSEDAKGTRIAEASTYNDLGRIVYIRNFGTKRMLMKELEKTSTRRR